MMLFSLSNICGTIRPFTPFDRPDEEMAFAGINDELCRHAERFQRMPKRKTATQGIPRRVRQR